MADCVNNLRSELVSDSQEPKGSSTTRTWAIVMVVCVAVGCVAHLRRRQHDERVKRHVDPLFQPF